MSAGLARRALALLAFFGSAGAAACSGSGGGGGASVPTLNGCAPSDYANASGTPTVNFGGQAQSPLFGYSPRCLQIAEGESVTFAGNFSVHPISPGTSPSDTKAGAANNPIPATTTGMSLSVTFPASGVYPYFCQQHYAAGMTGAILVE